MSLEEPSAVGEPLTPTLLLKLQRQVGNQAVLRLLGAVRRAEGGEADSPVERAESPRRDGDDRSEPEIDRSEEMPVWSEDRRESEGLSETEWRDRESDAEGESASDDGARIEPDDRLPWWRRLWRWLVGLCRRVWRQAAFSRVSGRGNRG